MVYLTLRTMPNVDFVFLAIFSALMYRNDHRQVQLTVYYSRYMHKGIMLPLPLYTPSSRPKILKKSNFGLRTSKASILLLFCRLPHTSCVYQKSTTF